MFTDNLNVLVLNFLEMKNTVFLSQKVDGNIFTDYWKVLVLIFSGMRNTAFFEPKSSWKDDIYGLLKSSCLNLFGNGKHGLFLSQKVDGKTMFTWSFLAFHDIPGLGKYGFSCSAYNHQFHIHLVSDIHVTRLALQRYKYFHQYLPTN